MTATLLVLGDSVPAGGATDADVAAWPRRLATRVDGLDDPTVRVDGGTATALRDLAADAGDRLDRAVADADIDAGDGPLFAFVHAGHNDAQTSGGEPRVPEGEFRAAARELDRALADRAAVDAHAFVGPVPLLPLDGPGTVPLSDAQPDRLLAYDDALADAVSDHVPVARPVADWRDRTADGVHPNADGHAFVADRVADWLAGRVRGP